MYVSSSSSGSIFLLNLEGFFVFVFLINFVEPLESDAFELDIEWQDIEASLLE